MDGKFKNGKFRDGSPNWLGATRIQARYKLHQPKSSAVTLNLRKDQ